MTSLSSAPPRTRFTRDPQHALVQLHERDIQILDALSSYRLLTTSQLARLFFTTKKRAERRLRQLYDAELVERIFRPVVRGSAEILYTLDKEGVNILVQERGTDRAEAHTARTRAQSLKPFFLDHFIEVNQFRLSVTLAAPAHNAALIFWKYEHELQNKNKKGVLISDRVTDPENPSQKIPVTPDGFFGLETSRGNTYFFVEIDRGTMDNQRFKRKMRGYARYWADNVFQEKWGYKNFRVLTATTPRRVPNLIKTTSQLKDTRLLSMFHFTDKANITPEAILNAVWRIPNRDGKQGIM